MKYSFTAAALFAATVSADLCSQGSVDAGGNWYCQLVHAITYTNVGSSGSYNQVTSMDSNSGQCQSSPKGYNGALSPLDEEVSLHFRGPMTLKQVAVYTPGGTTSKARRDVHEKRHGHGHAHNHQHLHEARKAQPEAAEAAPVEERQVGAEVYATIDGKLVSWVNEWSGWPTSATVAAPAAAATTAAAPVAASPAAAASSASSSSSSSSANIPAGAWGRTAYYDSESGTADGLVFLNHFGGTGSGVFDYSFGNSLSYASSNGLTGVSSPQVLADIQTTSATEVVIFSDQICNNGDCGYVRPGNVAYHGFDGPSKAFFFEFGMPSTGETGASQYVAVDMPAIWLLNAQIPRTLQYGNPGCSCWTTGCGEFDIFEVLAPGDTRCKSTLHAGIAGGDSDYFARPTAGTMKAVALLYNDNIHIKVLDDSTAFNQTIDGAWLNSLVENTSVQNGLTSLFALAGK